MRDRLRSFDSKITFFAFADIITAVSGMLIFITLLLATDLGRPTDNHSSAANAELNRQLQETLTKQAQVDAETRDLQQLLSAANTAPDPDKLQSDISRLRTELASEKSKHSGLAEQLAVSKSTLDERDKVLGITAVKETIQERAEELQAMARTNANIRDDTAALEKKIASVETKIEKLRAREGQVWLIPDRQTKSKEAILAIVGSSGLTLERFDHPELTQTFNKGGAHSGLESYLKRANPAAQYVVFLIRPSGIAEFKDLVEVARSSGFEVGFDALEEDREIHFTSPPPIDDQTVPAGSGRGTARTSTPMPGAGSTGAGGTYHPGGTSGGADNGSGNGPDGGAPGGMIGGTATNGAGGTNAVGGGTNDAGGGTNEIGGGTNAIGNGTNSIGGSGTNTIGGTNTGAGTNAVAQAGKTNGAASGSPQPLPKPKSWWQRFLEWLGIR